MAIGNLHNIIILWFKFIIILWFKFITNLIFVFTFTYCLKEAFNKGSGLKLLININLFFDLFWAFSFLIHSWHSIERKNLWRPHYQKTRYVAFMNNFHCRDIDFLFTIELLNVFLSYWKEYDNIYFFDTWWSEGTSLHSTWISFSQGITIDMLYLIFSIESLCFQ